MTPDDSSSGLPTCSVRADGLFTQPQVWVDQEQGDQQTNLAGTVEGLQTIILTMIHAIDSRPVAEDVIQRLGLRMEPAELLDSLSVEQLEGTSFLRLRYEDTDPERAN